MLKNNHYSKWALAKAIFVLPLIVFLLMLNCKQKSQESSIVENYQPEVTVIYEFDEDGLLKEESVLEHQEQLTEGVYKVELLWDSKGFIDELRSEYLYFYDGEFQYLARTGKPDFIEIQCAKHKKVIYEAQRNEEGDICITELSTGNKNPSFLKLRKEEEDNMTPQRFAQVMPEPIGGFETMYQFLNENLKYPENAREQKISGNVFLEFVVERNGLITCVRVISGVDPELDAEALRVIKMLPRWKPGMEKGKPVRCFYQIPLRFTIN
jgi:TonB family protein